MNSHAQEFDRQVQNLIDKKYPDILKISINDFKNSLNKLQNSIETAGELNLVGGKIPFVIVIKSPNREAEQLMEHVEREGKQGYSKMFPHEAKEFYPQESLNIPKHFAYLLVDIDRGKETINIAPQDALKTILEQNRSPLTIDEGVAIVTQYPDFLMKNNCFSLLGSRCPGNKRVPAIWINAAKRPNLGWCWDGNPHTWLGSASCSERVG